MMERRTLAERSGQITRELVRLHEPMVACGRMLRIECESCHAPYQVDERRVPPQGMKMRCPKCGHSFTVTRPDVTSTRAAPTDAEIERAKMKSTMAGLGGFGVPADLPASKGSVLPKAP